MRSVMILMVILAITMVSFSTIGHASDTINYQGKLMSVDGTPVDTTEEDPLPITFKYYDSLMDETELCSENHDVSVTNGFFSVKLGPFCSDFIAQVGDENGSWIGITVNEEVMSPKLEITNSFAVL